MSLNVTRSTGRCYLDRSVDVDQMQQRLRHLGQELPKEHQDLLNHSRGVLGRGMMGNGCQLANIGGAGEV